jgi:hypothetical protein
VVNIYLNKVLSFFCEIDLFSILVPVFTTIIGIFIGAKISYSYGMKQAKELDCLRRKKEERTAVLNIAGELLRIIKCYDYLIDHEIEDRPFEIWGMFIPENSFWKYSDIMQAILTENEFKDLENAYITFSVYDRQMQGVIQAWLVSGQNKPTPPAVRWNKVFWSSISSEDTKDLIKRLQLLLEKLKGMNYQ